MILDIGPAAVEALADVLKTCRTLVWNGPLGAFETPPFDAATVALAKTAAALTKEGSLVSVAGGGDTVAALNHAGVAHDFTFVSTAGGAFLEWMEGLTLPGVAASGSETITGRMIDRVVISRVPRLAGRPAFYERRLGERWTKIGPVIGASIASSRHGCCDLACRASRPWRRARSRPASRLGRRPGQWTSGSLPSSAGPCWMLRDYAQPARDGVARDRQLMLRDDRARLRWS